MMLMLAPNALAEEPSARGIIAPSPFARAGEPSPPPTPAAAAKAPFASGLSDAPFGRAEPRGPVIPSGPHSTVAVPVENVDAIEASEAAPPTPVAREADPVQVDPAEPTELTSPIFEPQQGLIPNRLTRVRVLNKVTAQAQLLTLKPNETASFGQLEVTAIACQVSTPQSQTDYAGLLDIAEKSSPMTSPTAGSTKPLPPKATPLFHGWMYASSPSITALEHPVYDVTMVSCDDPILAKKTDENEQKTDKKPAKKGKK